MLIQDRIYGEFTITSPIILELIHTPLFQRLKQINQFGIPDEFYHLQGYSRYEHSIGVFLLLQKFGATEEEQVAGLLHDISHTAFSHLIDWVIGDQQKEDFQDNRHLSVLQDPQIQSVLEKYGYKSDHVADYHRFSLLDQDMPQLCADRVDYVFRELSPEIVTETLPHITSRNGKIVFANQKSARIFADAFLERQTQHWAGYEGVTRYSILAQLLKEALEHNILTVDDFSLDDTTVIEKIRNSRDIHLLHGLDVLRAKNLDHLTKANTPIIKKFRFIDPEFLNNENKLVTLSSVDPKFREQLELAGVENSKGILPGILA